MSQERKVIGRIALQRAPTTPTKDAPAPASATTLALTEAQLERELAALRGLSERYGTPGIDLDQICLRLTDLDAVPRVLAEQKQILPVLLADDRLFLAMVVPNDQQSVEDLEFLTAKRVFGYVALPATLMRTLAAAYDARNEGASFYVGPRCPSEVQRRMGALASIPRPTESETTLSPPSIPASVSPETPRTLAKYDELSYTDIGSVDRELSVVEPLPEEDIAEPPRTMKGTLLVVDDDAEIRHLLRATFTEHGYRVLEADRGLEALRLVKAHVPDVLVLDVNLPEVHGFDIARRIRGSAKYGHIPILMMSAIYRGREVAEDVKANYDVDAYIEKPFRLADMVATLGRILQEARARGSLQEAPEGTRSSAVPFSSRRDPSKLSAEAERYLKEGVAAYQQGDLLAAIENLKQGLTIDPLAFRLRVHLGLLYGKQGLLFEAIGELERAIELNEKHFPALKNLAVLYQKTGFRHKAAEAWKRALKVAPNEATGRLIKEHLLELLLTNVLL